MLEPPKFDRLYEDHTVLITGGTQGIGYAIAQAYRSAGARTIITGTKTQQDYAIDLSEHQYIQMDLNDPNSTENALKSVDKLDILINNAGGINSGINDRIDSPEIFERNFSSNLFGAYRLSHIFLPLLSESLALGGASIINITSIAAFRSTPLTLGYAAAKAGLVNLTKGLSCALAKDKIRCNAIAPGSIMVARMKPHFQDEGFKQSILRRIPLRRFGEPEDICGPCLFLTSPWASYITGQVLLVDGGMAEGLFSN